MYLDYLLTYGSQLSSWLYITMYNHDVCSVDLFLKKRSKYSFSDLVHNILTEALPSPEKKNVCIPLGL